MSVLTALAAALLTATASAAPTSDPAIEVDLWTYLRPTQVTLEAQDGFESSCDKRSLARARSLTLTKSDDGKVVVGGQDEAGAPLEGLCDAFTAQPSGVYAIKAAERSAHLEGPFFAEVVETGLRFVHRIPLESYVARVVAAAMTGDDSPIWLQTMALVARSFPVYWRMEGLDGPVCDTDFCNPLSREATVPNAALEAARTTAGKVVYGKRDVIRPLNHPLCGGATLPVEQVFEYEADYLGAKSIDKSVLAQCEAAPGYRWEKTLEKEEILEALQPDLFYEGTVWPTLTVEGQALQIVDHQVRIQQLRNRLAIRAGEEVLPSNTFELINQEARARFEGFGRGHGVGLCHCAARAMAAAGKTPEAILEFFYPGARLVSTPPLKERKFVNTK